MIRLVGQRPIHHSNQPISRLVVSHECIAKPGQTLERQGKVLMSDQRVSAEHEPTRFRGKAVDMMSKMLNS